MISLRPRPFGFRQMADTELECLNVVDVYDLAAAIGKEFEVIIDNHGPEAVTELMPKVIHVLEHLEILANKTQQEDCEVQELRDKVHRLEQEKQARAEERQRYEKELEQIEESWRKENKQLYDNVAQLREDNRRVHSALTAKEDLQAEQLQQVQEEEEQLLLKLRDEGSMQRERIRALEHDLALKSIDLEALQQQNERVTKLNTDYRRKTKLTQRQAQNLISEKVELQGELHDKEQLIEKIKEQMDEHQNHSLPSPDSEFDKLQERLTLEGKMIVDMKDPNRPRFTMNELRDVLKERNELKTKLLEVEEELSLYRPETLEDVLAGHILCSHSNSRASSSSPYPDYDDAPVQGPINKEPDEKLYPGKDSGIRKFFKFFSGSSKPRKAASVRRSPRQTQQKTGQPT